MLIDVMIFMLGAAVGYLAAGSLLRDAHQAEIRTITCRFNEVVRQLQQTIAHLEGDK